MPVKKAAVFMILFLLCTLLPAAAQETTGTILGTVTDSSGAVVPGATSLIANTDKNAVLRKVTSGKDGSFTAPLLPIGHYSVTVEAQGFRSFTKSNLELNIRDQYRVDATLAPGSVTENVTVEADALQVDTESATATGLINGTQIRELSLSQRNYEELVALTPGVSSGVSDNIFVGVETPGGGATKSIFPSTATDSPKITGPLTAQQR